MLGTIGFACLFEVRAKNLFYCGLCGAVGWMIYKYMGNVTGVFMATFCSAMGIVILARLFAKLRRTPTPVFYIPGIFPIVPGAGIYNTAYAIVMNELGDAKIHGLITLKTSCAIVLGVAIISLFPYRFQKLRKHGDSVGDRNIPSERLNDIR